MTRAVTVFDPAAAAAVCPPQLLDRVLEARGRHRFHREFAQQRLVMAGADRRDVHALAVTHLADHPLAVAQLVSRGAESVASSALFHASLSAIDDARRRVGV